MKIVLFNVKYSLNLGDGVIAECLENAIHEQTGATVVSLDLAGRDSYGGPPPIGRTLAIRLFRHMPGVLRRMLVRKRLKPFLAHHKVAWAEVLRDADLAIIGGGNLFQDADLNFPLKISAALEASKAAGVPVAIHAVGVAPGWSNEAHALFSRIQDNDVRHISLRDQASFMLWQRLIGQTAVQPTINGDPGLLAQGLQRPAKPFVRKSSLRVGLCVSHPALLRYHSHQMVAGTERGGGGFYRDLVLTLCDRGERVTLFTNGAAEDRAYISRLTNEPMLLPLLNSGQLMVAPHCETPSDLVAQIGEFHAIIAHRLHACIIAYALRIPHVGLAWDVKVESFFRSVSREDYFVRSGGDSPVKIAALTARAMTEGIDPDRHRRVLQRTRDEIRLMLTSANLTAPADVGAVA